MEQAKEKIIADLYALRAGLSVISEQTDEIKKKEAVIQSNAKTEEEISHELSAYKDELAGCEIMRAYYRQKIDRAQRDIQAIKKEKQEKIKDKEELLNDKKWITRHSSGRPLPFYLIHFFSFFCTLVLGISTLVIGFQEDDGPPLGLLIFVAVAYLITLLDLYITKKDAIRITKNKLNKDIEDILSDNYRIESHEREISQTRALLQKEEEKIAHTQAKVKETEERLNQCVAQNTAIKEEQNRQIQGITEDSKLVKASLNAVCDSWIAESDWGNVDLLIYYLESRRADTLKEALHHLDQQKQTNQIVNAISEARSAIQSSIQSSTMRLATALEESFTLISKQLKDVSKKMGRFTSVVEEGQRIQRAQSDVLGEMGSKIVKLQQEQLSATELNRVLLEKSNQSSETLLNDLRYNQKFWIK